MVHNILLKTNIDLENMKYPGFDNIINLNNKENKTKDIYNNTYHAYGLIEK